MYQVGSTLYADRGLPAQPRQIVLQFQKTQNRFPHIDSPGSPKRSEIARSKPARCGERRTGGIPQSSHSDVDRLQGFPSNEDLWLPVAFDMPPDTDRGASRSFAVFGRLRDGIPRETAEAEARVIARRIGEENPDLYPPLSARVFPFAQPLMPPGVDAILIKPRTSDTIRSGS